MAEKKRKVSKKEAERAAARLQIISRAVVDEAFRAKLFRNPQKVFGTALSKQDRAALRQIRASLPLLDAQLSHLSGKILCIDGGGGGGIAV